MNILKAGDAVSLKSNPEIKMTVKLINGNQITCSWVNKNGDPIDEEYDINLLDKYINSKEIALNVMKNMKSKLKK